MIRPAPVILVLGASGMLGNAMFRFFAEHTPFDTFGSVRSDASKRLLPDNLQDHIITGTDVANHDSLIDLFERVKPQVVINCVGVVKQLDDAKNPLHIIPINSILPHQLAHLSNLIGARFIHLSTDCVFTGETGFYSEESAPDARDLYGLSKLLGEVDYSNSVTLRTSIIGHELNSAHSLISWFLAQTGSVRGFSKAIFSGLPTVEIARIIYEYVLPSKQLSGLYHLSAEPIDKEALLNLVKTEYGKEIHIDPDATLVIDRSLNSSKFRKETGYQPPSWSELVQRMHQFQ